MQLGWNAVFSARYDLGRAGRRQNPLTAPEKACEDRERVNPNLLPLTYGQLGALWAALGAPLPSYSKEFFRIQHHQHAQLPFTTLKRKPSGRTIPTLGLSRQSLGRSRLPVSGLNSPLFLGFFAGFYGFGVLCGWRSKSEEEANGPLGVLSRDPDGENCMRSAALLVL